MNLRQRMASTYMCRIEEGEPTLTVLDFGQSSSYPIARDPSREQQGHLPPFRPDCRHAMVPCTFRIQVSRLSQDTSFPVSSCLWQVYGYPFLGALPPFYNNTLRRRITCREQVPLEMMVEVLEQLVGIAIRRACTA